MMGSSGASGAFGEFGSFYDLIALLKDDKLLEPKIRELDDRVKSAKNTLAQAVEINQKVIENRKLATDILESATTKVVEARALKCEQVALAQQCADRLQALAKQQEAHSRAVASYGDDKSQHSVAVATAEQKLAARERAVVEAEARVVALLHQANLDIAALHKVHEAKCTVIIDQANSKLNDANLAQQEAAKATAALTQKKVEYEEFFSKMKI